MQQGNPDQIPPAPLSPDQHLPLAQMIQALENEEFLHPDDLKDIWLEEMARPIPSPEGVPVRLRDAWTHPGKHSRALNQLIQYAESNRKHPNRLFPSAIYAAMITITQVTLLSKQPDKPEIETLIRDAQSLLEEPWLDDFSKEMLSNGLKCF